ncbi:type I inositol polyphosphate 5-phosphatase 8-like isoform X1 [Primulina tabacum]|uniref:type I inositol polyphosphate 5-phosphatase 8-like isoform X1 n=2 Tax=Primulina tabacum TaxID=48773 RepID=UPI003F5A0AB3
MREKGASLKSYWPRMVVRKLLNMKSIGVDEFHSDYGIKGGKRKSSFEDGCYVVVPEELSEKWLMEANNERERLRFNQLQQPITNSEDLRMFVGTWNVGGKSPPVELDLKDWLRTNSPADIYVLGFQETVPLTAGNVLGPEDGATASKWLSLIHRALNEQHLSGLFPFQSEFIKDTDFEIFSSFGSNSSSSEQGSPSPPEHHCRTIRHRYCMAAGRQMVGIYLSVWVREDMYRHISCLNVSCVGTGILGRLGNKGSVSVSMTLHQTSFCFVCTHLASGEKEGDAIRRNSDVMDILKRTRFSNQCRILGESDPPAHILDHDKIIWLGDLNYRLATICGDTYDLLQLKDWQALLLKDQLRIEQRAGRVFKGWEEGAISFAPTYKYFPDSDQYVNQTSTAKEKRRTPAWCDRILWKGKGLKQMSYSRGESRFSDHRPVVSLFAVQVNVPTKLEPTTAIASNTAAYRL